MTQRRLHVIRHFPATPAGRPPLVFLHGGYVDARCWEAHFLPCFASHGYECHAPDLAGHGRSDGVEPLDALSLDDYLADSIGVVERLDRKPVVIGHSMGACIAERLLELSLVEAGVLLSPVPPHGTLESALTLFLRYPGFLSEVARMTRGVFDERSLRLLRDVYFTPATQPETLLDLARLVQPESLRAICDLSLLAWRCLPAAPELPVLVVGGELDAVFPPHMASRVAKRWQAELEIVPAAGHAMILDRHWQTCADHILDWLDRLEQARPKRPSASIVPAGSA